MSYWNIENVITKDDYLLKIALYADLRIGPFGIMSLHERLEDAHQRVAKYKNRPELKEFAYVLEKQISSHLNIDLYSINNSDIEPDKNLLAYSI